MKTTMDTLAFATIKELRTLLADREISSQELLESCIKRFSVHDGDLQSALEIFETNSILERSQKQGMLFGIPGILKDNISQEGRTLTCASKILEGFNAAYDATATARLKKEGALILGRANMDEFAMGSSGETSAYQKTKNPWDSSRVPGGSSSGSIAAVAAGLVPWALGSETGGSVRLPAAFCGIVGSKPTYGLVSRSGLVAYASSLDQIGVVTRTVYDNAVVLSAIAGHDPKDSSSLAVEKKDYTQSLDGKIPANLRIGIVENALYAPGMNSEVVVAIEEAIKVLEGLGAKTRRIKLSTMDYSAATYFILSRAEAASNLARFDGVRYGLRDKKAATLTDMYCNTRHDGFGAEVKARILIGNYVLSAGYADAYYEKAKKVQRMMCKEFTEMFNEVDLLVMPTHPEPAFKFGAFDTDKLAMDLQDYFTCAMNLVGIPALNVPCGFTQSNLPIGFQFAGPHLSDELILQVAHAYEQATPWHTMHPKGF
ncbi:MAG: Asp-tRNA(Asn)/Glu-tRNA(Gln) amidotransferase subunit GatA [Candidatus Dependentiae bacterium]|nr:Asp-tRNA(Asn)/Glu-tRNA(Gln) amidotransferase subunit GatA [Candidatus Dependentiae bacterium]